MLRILALIFAGLTLASCATLSEDACRGGDWFSIGVADGERGRTPAYLAEHAEACAKFGIAPVRSTWEQGRQQGLKSYCTVETHYQEGRRGRRLSLVCPAQDQERLAIAHAAGRSYWKIEQEIEELEDELDEIEDDIKALGPDDDAARSALMLDRLRTRGDLLRLKADLRRYDTLPPGI